MTREHTFTAWVYRGRNETEHEVEVTYTVTDFIPATHLQPAEGGEVEIVSTSIDVTRNEWDYLYDTACERAESDLAEWREGQGEYLADCRRDARVDD